MNAPALIEKLLENSLLVGFMAFTLSIVWKYLRAKDSTIILKDEIILSNGKELLEMLKRTTESHAALSAVLVRLADRLDAHHATEMQKLEEVLDVKREKVRLMRLMNKKS